MGVGLGDRWHFVAPGIHVKWTVRSDSRPIQNGLRNVDLVMVWPVKHNEPVRLRALKKA